jgi:hypothetical protein
MSTAAIVGLIIVVLLAIALVALVAQQLLRRQQLRGTFGPEYEHTVEEHEEHDSHRAADQELADREKRHEQLAIRQISPTTRDNYTRRWGKVQEEFVDAPTDAVTDADRLLTDLMAERGYPTDDGGQKIKYLSVEYSNTLDAYRAAHDISLRNRRGEASTEDLRSAMVQYRSLFDDLLAPGGGPGSR